MDTELSKNSQDYGFQKYYRRRIWMKFHGSITDLEKLLQDMGYSVKERVDRENSYQIKTQEGAIVNWFPTTGTVNAQGKQAAKLQFEEVWKSNFSDSQTNSDNVRGDFSNNKTATREANRRVFVVHGHDVVAREQLELVLHRLGLNPFVLANTGGGGLTIIEALEAEIGPSPEHCRFGIVLMTPDDMGYSRADGPEHAQYRARQNVVLEMGMLISAIGRRNVAILKKGPLEVPSDAQGIIYLPFTDHVKETVPQLVDRLRQAGFNLEPEAITRAST